MSPISFTTNWQNCAKLPGSGVRIILQTFAELAIDPDRFIVKQTRLRQIAGE
jgi:hypothetical protein